MYPSLGHKQPGRQAALPSAPAGHAAAERATCPQCGQEQLVSAVRRYCSGCGHSLWDACPACGSEGPVGQVFCGSCGKRVDELWRQRGEAYGFLLDEARQLAAEHRYPEARRRLQSVAELPDRRHQALAAEAQQRLAALDAAARQAEEAAERARQQAEQHLAAREYERAVTVLHRIPPPLRSEAVALMLQQAGGKYNEWAALRAELEDAVRAKKWLGLRDTLDRLLVLKPDDEPARRTADALRPRLVRAARQRLAAHRYHQAVQLLDAVPAVVRDQEVERLTAAAQELAWLLSRVRTAAVVDATLLRLVQRLQERAPRDPQVADLQARLQRRAAQPPDDPRHVAPNWSPSHSGALGFPIDWLGGLRNFAAAAEVLGVLREQPGRFFVALGLALQGLDRAAVPINLAPPEKAGPLARWRLWRSRPLRTAWGLDVGDSSVKAVKLSGGADDAPLRVETLALQEHARCLTLAADEVERRQLIRQSLEQLRGQAGDEPACVYVGLPRQLSLGRTVRLPPVSEKQVAETVRLEARVQLPFAPEDMKWGYHAQPIPAAAEGDACPWDVVLSAAKTYHVESALEICREAGWNVDGVQSDCLALHNFLRHEQETPPTGADPPTAEAEHRDAVALLDVGVRTTALVVSTARSVWFRSLPFGSEQIDSLLVLNFKLTRGQAEQWKRQPTAGRQLSRMHGCVEPALVRLLDEIQRSLEVHARLFPDVRVRQMYGVGGGFGFHGLLRLLRTGQ